MFEHFLCNQADLLNNCPFGQKNIDPVTVYDQLFLCILESHRHTAHQKEYKYEWR